MAICATFWLSDDTRYRNLDRFFYLLLPVFQPLIPFLFTLETIGFVGTGIGEFITELAACRFHYLSIAILIGWLLTYQG